MCSDKSQAPFRKPALLKRHLLQHALEQREILLHLFSQILAIESHRRMVADQVLSPVAFDYAPARLVDALNAEHLLGRHAAEQHDQYRVDNLDLLKEVIGCAGFDLAHSRRAVVRRAAFDDVGDEEVVAVDASALEDLVEE